MKITFSKWEMFGHFDINISNFKGFYIYIYIYIYNKHIIIFMLNSLLNPKLFFNLKKRFPFVS